MAGAGLANWQSYYGENSIDQWMLPYFGASVYDDPAVYARSSPIQFIKQARTPTLILQGERDAEVPAPQAYEFWHALKSLGVDGVASVRHGKVFDIELAGSDKATAEAALKAAADKLLANTVIENYRVELL